VSTPDFWRNQPVIPVVVINDSANAIDLARTLVEAGLTKIEITLRTSAALSSIELIANAVPEAIVGAGTVINEKTAQSALNAGAKYLVSPGATSSVLSALDATKLPYLPGAATVSEALALVEHGVNTAKFFPAVESGGISWLKAVSTVIPQLSFCPTGGISPANYREFLALPNVVCVGGSWVAPSKLIEEKNWTEISRLSKDVFALENNGK
jgi:2-dehydro-3-deoxyphosphogluconate aldolase/(4S)-4-hydroxy-2-oxoglutarate aldolase